MPLQRPSFEDLLEQNERDFDARIPGGDSRLRRSVLAVLARVVARATHYLYGALDFIARQLFVDTAEREFLDRHAVLWGVQRKAAIFATGSVTVSGVDGAVIPVESILRRSDGVEFGTDAPATIASGVATIAVTASLPGSIANTAAASALTFASPIESVEASAIVAAGGITGGEDQESDQALAARVKARISNPPQGGAAHDYIAWTLEVPGVTRAWVLPEQFGPGTVGIIFVRDGDPTPIPDAGEIAIVQEYLDARRPVTADVTVFAPTEVPLAFTIHIEPDTAEIRAAVQAELADLIEREGGPSSTLRISRIREAISRAEGEVHHVLTSPNADLVIESTELRTLGTITWT